MIVFIGMLALLFANYLSYRREEREEEEFNRHFFTRIGFNDEETDDLSR